MQKSKLWIYLGYAGLLPFISLALLSAFSNIEIGLSTHFVFTCYSASILSFLAGSIWLQGQTQALFGPTLCSNLITLLAFISLLLSYPIGIVLLLIGYLIVFWIEIAFKLYANKPDGYKTMRSWLTVVVLLCHFVILVRSI